MANHEGRRRRPAHRCLLSCGLALAVATTAIGCSQPEPEDPAVFCDALRAANAPTGAVANVDLDDPTTIDAAVAELGALADLAPDGLDDDIDVIAGAYREVLDAVVSTAPAARADVLRSLQPRLDEAAEPSRRLQQYGERTCGIGFAEPQQPTPTPTPLDIDD